jgi:hypothetical protein
MQYLFTVVEEFLPDGSRADEAGSANAEEMAAVHAFNEKLIAGGQRLFAGGLAAPNRATTFDNRRGAGIVSDGPFAEAREFAGGLWIIEAEGAAEATALGAEASLACNRRVEVRPFLA